MTLKQIRKIGKVKIQDIDLDRRTIAKIENGDCNIKLCSLQKYLEAIGMKLNYSIK
jgi:transcriptional regulator with XRE-family HTH domain